MRPAPDPPNPAAPPQGRLRRRARLAVRVALAVGGLVAVLLGATWLLLPRLVDLDAVKGRVVAELSTRLPVAVRARTVELTLRPLPRLTLRGAWAAVPGIARIEAEAAVVTADPWSLLRGAVRIRSIRLQAPRVVVRIPEVPESEELSEFSVAAAEESLARVAAVVGARLPGAALSAKDGRVELFDGKRTRFWFDRVAASASFSPHSLAVDARCTASVGGRLTAALSLDTDRWVGRGRASASRLGPDPVARYLNPGRPSRVTGAQWSGEVAVEARGRGVWEARIAAVTPSLVAWRRGRRLPLKDLRADGSVAVDGPRWTVDLKRASLAEPRVRLSGAFSWDPAARRAALAAQASDLAIAPLRAAALALAPDVPLVRTLCDIFRDGRVPGLSISSQAAEPARLGSVEHLALRGGLREGVLQIPGAGLPATEASGEVVVAGGTLTGADLAGRSGASSARNGRLRLGLVGARPPFHFEADLSADLAELRQRLPGWLPPGPVRDEVGLVDAARGRAVGRLVLGERLHDLSAAVEVRRFEVAGRFRRIPFPMELAGSFSLRGNRVAVGGLSGRVGDSAIAGAGADVTFGRVPRLRITAARGNLALSELYPWALTAPAGRRLLRDFGRPSGRLLLSSLVLNGPASIPSQWTFRARGGVERLSVQSLWFPGSLLVERADLQGTDQTLAWSNLHGTLLDATATSSGRADGLRSGPRTVAASLEGVVGPRAARWIGQEAAAPKALRVSRAVAVRQGRVAWAESGADFSADLAPAGGPSLSVEVHRTRDRLTVPKLLVKDESSDARLHLDVHDGAWDLGFSGRLHGDTVDALLDRGLFSFTLIEGDFRAQVRPDAPRESSATGRLGLTGVRVTAGAGPPVAIESAALAGAGKTLTIEGARVAVGPARFTLAGRIEARPQEYRPELTVAAGELDAKALKEALGPAGGGWSRVVQALRELPVHGSAAVQVGTLRYGRYAWSPVRAGVTLTRGVLAADIQEARLCGVSTPGKVEIGPSRIGFDLAAAADGPELDALLACLWDRKGLATGSFRFAAKAQASGQPGKLLRSSAGDFSFSAREGRIYRFGLLAKVFAVLNVTEVFRGRLPDLFHEGFGYRTIDAQGVLRDGHLMFRGANLDGASLRIFWEGEVDVARREVDLTVLVAPFRTIDAILQRVPVLGYLMGGRLVAVPLRVRGSLDDPSVVPLHPADIGAGLLGVVERTLKLPFHLIQPLLPSAPQP